MGVFDAFATDDRLTLPQIKTRTRGDRRLLHRIMRLLTAHSIFNEVDVDTWESTNIVKALGSGQPFAHGVVHL